MLKHTDEKGRPLAISMRTEAEKIFGGMTCFSAWLLLMCAFDAARSSKRGRYRHTIRTIDEILEQSGSALQTKNDLASFLDDVEEWAFKDDIGRLCFRDYAVFQAEKRMEADRVRKAQKRKENR